MMTKRYFSASQIGMFLFCPLQHKHVYVDGNDKFEPNAYTLYGTAVHAALAHNYKQKITTRKDLEGPEVAQVFLSEFRKEYVKLPPQPSYVDFRTLELQGDTMVRKYLKEVAPSLQPIMVEEKKFVRIETADIDLCVIMDLVTEDEIIHDHKTAGASTETKRTQASVDNNHQLTAYALGYRKIFNKPEAGLSIDVLKRLKEGPKFDCFRTTRTYDDVVALAKLMNRMKKIIDGQLQYPNLDNCARCPLQNTCRKAAF